MLWALLLSVFLLAGVEEEGAERIEFAVVTHPKNPVKSLKRAQLVKHLRAETRYWSRSQSVYLLLPRTDTSTKRFLLEHVYEMSEIELKRYWVSLVYRNRLRAIPKVMPSTAVALAVARSQPGSLTLVEARAVKDRKDVKILAIDGRLPGDEGYWPSMLREESGQESEKKAQDKDGSKREGTNGGAWHPAALVQADADDDLDQLVAILEERLAGSAGELDLTTGLSLRGFADVTLGARSTDSDDPTAGNGSSEFAIGQLDLFFTAQLGERVSFLNETVFETDEDGEAVLDIERLIVKYDFGDAASLEVGRVHSNLGYWNTAFHHGEWLQTTVGRPRILDFEDEGGLLPVHLIGLSLEARRETGAGELQANLELGNGRGATPDQPQITSDLNDSKAVNLGLTLSPNALAGLRVGTGLYMDDIPANADLTEGPTHDDLDETIWFASAAYHMNDWTALGEFFSIAHDGSSGDTDSMGYYLQLEHRLGDWTPYARFEGVEVDDADTFFEDLEDLNRFVLGLRWELNAWNAIKLQVSHSAIDAGPGGADRDETEVLIQSAFAF